MLSRTGFSLSIVCLIALCSVVSVFSGTSTAVKRDDRRIVKLFGGATAWDAIKHPNRVEAYRIKIADNSSTNGHTFVGGCEITGGPFPVEHRCVDDMIQVLKDPGMYLWDDQWMCVMIPGV